MNMHPDPPLHLEADSPSPENVLLELLPGLRDAQDGEEVLRQGLAAIISATPSCKAFAWEWDTSSGSAQLHTCASTDSQLANDYFARFRSIDPFASEALCGGNVETDHSFLAREIMSPERLRQHPFHSRFLAPNGDLIWGLGHYANSGEHRSLGVRLFRQAERPSFTTTERDHLGLFSRHIAAHLRQVRQLHQLRHANAALQSMVDAWSRPIILLSQSGEVMARNEAAEQILSEESRIRLQDSHLMPGTRHDHATPIHAALRRLLSNRTHGSQDTSRCIALPGENTRIARHYALLVRRPSDPRAPESSAAAMLVLIDLQQQAACHPLEELRELFGFTITEARVANALVMGLSTEEVAQTFLVRPDTVRGHIKRLLAKTRNRNYSELQRLLMRLAPDLVALTNEHPF